MHRGFLSSSILFVAFAAASISAGPLFAADGPTVPHPPTASTDQNGFTAAERKTVLNFLLQFDMGKAVQPGVVALVRSGDQACAVRLVMDSYAVPQETAELVVRVFAQSEGRKDAPQGQ